MNIMKIHTGCPIRDAEIQRQIEQNPHQAAKIAVNLMREWAAKKAAKTHGQKQPTKN